MAFYTFWQNDSLNRFDINENVAYFVTIEAETAEEANRIAQEKGLYFHGVDDGIDCLCHGNRWCPVDEQCKEDEFIKRDAYFRGAKQGLPENILYRKDGSKEVYLHE